VSPSAGAGAARGRRVTEILPGITRTGFAAARHRGDEARAATFYEGFPSTMVPDDVARTVLLALDQPPHVTIAQLVVVPTHNVQ
jgi:3-hydroxy acid dehydrogenase / malonic semialdehyde reductase